MDDGNIDKIEQKGNKRRSKRKERRKRGPRVGMANRVLLTGALFLIAGTETLTGRT